MKSGFAAGAALLAIVARASYPRMLERREAERHPVGPDGIILGAEPILLKRDGAPAILCIHGGGDTPQAMREMANHLHENGFAVQVPLLEGHGRELRAMRTFDAEKWRAQVRREFDVLRSRHSWVGVAGLSLGGALALDLAAERGDVGALVLLAPYVAAPQLVRVLAQTRHVWGALVPYLPSQGGRSIHDPSAAARALTYGLVTPSQLHAVSRAADFAEAALSRVKAPTLVIQSREDNRIPVDVATRAFEKLGATEKRFVWTEGAGHVITVDYGKDRVFAQTAEWMQAHVRP
jgi:carboxylesterase